MYWDKEYEHKSRLWGEAPSVLAVAAVDYLKKFKKDDSTPGILDIGCGYGRDAFHYAEYLECTVCGKRFRRQRRNTVLSAHNDPAGSTCWGRHGYVVDQYIN